MHIMSSVEELMPSVGTPVPSPSILAVLLRQSDSTLQNIGKTDVSSPPFLSEDFDNPFDFCEKSVIVSKRHLISISDDGKLWNWLLTAEGHADTQKDDKKLGSINGDSTVSLIGTQANTSIPSSNDSRTCMSSSTFNQEDIILKVSLYLQTLSLTFMAQIANSNCITTYNSIFLLLIL